MITKIDGFTEFGDKKIILCMDEESNNSRYHIEGTSSEYPYTELKIMVRRIEKSQA